GGRPGRRGRRLPRRRWRRRGRRRRARARAGRARPPAAPACRGCDVGPRRYDGSITTHDKPRRVLLLYNTDYDEELKAQNNVDVSAVQAAAMAVCRAACDAGLNCEIMGLEGRDVGRLLDRLAADPPDLVFNLVESLCGDTRNELLVPALLDMWKVPYTGPGPMTLGLCLDKERSKQVLLQH